MTLAYEARYLEIKADKIRETISAIDSTLAAIYAEIARQDAEDQDSERWKD